MVIKVSTLLAHNTVVQDDITPVLGGNLNTNNFSIANGLNSVTISGNNYPVDLGTVGQVISTNGNGILSFSDVVSSITLTGDVTGSGSSTITTVLSDTTVSSGSYGSGSTIGIYTVNSQGRLTSASSVPIVITPTSAGLGNVTNSLQVINNGGAPSIHANAGVPTGSATSGALYVDENVTNGVGIYRYNGASWDPIAENLNLYAENSSTFITPVAQGINSIALGEGAQTAVAAVDSLAIGNQSLARLQGSVMQASGRFASAGDAQAGRYLLRTNTINGIPTEVFIDGTAGILRLVLPDDSTWTYKITVTGHRTDASNGHAGYTAAGVIYRASGVNTTSLQGSPNKVALAESNPSWDINISADPVNGSLKITVTGETGKTIRWVVLVETVEVTN